MDGGNSHSEVARLREKIRLEYEAAQQGMSGLALGTAQHRFITARMEQIGAMHQQLIHLVGPDEATKLLAETLESL